MCVPVLNTVNGSFLFLPDWNEKKANTCFPLIFPWIDYNLSLFLIEICVHARVYGSVFVWVCNLCGTAGAWSVHLAGVQQAAHRIMMTVAVACVFWGCERRIKTQERERRWRRNEEKCPRWKRKGLRGKQHGLQTGQPWRGRCRKKRHTKKEEDRRAVCLHWIISVG